MLCAGRGSRKSDGVTPSLTLNMHLNPPASDGPPSSAASSRPTSRPSSGRRPASCPNAAAGGASEATAVASVQLRPSTVWLSLPLLQRLQSFFEPLANMPATATQGDRCEILWCVCQPVQCVLLAMHVTADTPGTFVKGRRFHCYIRCFDIMHTCFISLQFRPGQT